MGTNFVDWSWASEHVQTEVVNGEYLSSETALIMAGPPRLSQVNANTSLGGRNGRGATALDQVASQATILFPVGLISDFTLQQARNIRPVFEIGSVRRYLIPEKISTTLRLSRVKFFGPSLMRVLYAYYPSEIVSGLGGTFATAINNGAINVPNVDSGEEPGYGAAGTLPVGVNFGKDPEEVDGPLNNQDWWINLQSVIFRQPLGLCLYMKSSNDQSYGAAYMEECYIGRHGFQISSEQVMIMEAVDMEMDRIRPIRLTKPPRTNVNLSADQRAAAAATLRTQSAQLAAAATSIAP